MQNQFYSIGTKIRKLRLQSVKKNGHLTGNIFQTNPKHRQIFGQQLLEKSPKIAQFGHPSSCL